MNQQDWCDFFRKIEENPERIISGMTVGDMVGARAHASECEDCIARIDRVNAKAPPQTFMDIQGIN